MRWHGSIGFSNGTVEKVPHSGIMVADMEERIYSGEVITPRYVWEESGHQNDDFSIGATISIVAADPYIQYNYSRIKYAEYQGVRWKVVSVIPGRPRIQLRLGGIWNGPIPT